MSAEADVVFAARELALSDTGSHHVPEAGKAGLKVLEQFKEALTLAGLEPRDGVEEPDSLEVVFTHCSISIGVVLSRRNPQFFIRRVGTFRNSSSPSLPVPLAYDRSTRTFVGTELDHDIALAVGQYPPRKSALRVLTEAIKEVVPEVGRQD